MARGVDNNGVGALYGTFDIHMTGSDYDLTDGDIGKAVAITGNNEAGFGSDGGILLGRLEHVFAGVATVQIAGVVRLPVAATAPSAGESVVVDGEGAIKQSPGLSLDLGGTGVSEIFAAGAPGARGIVLAVDSAGGAADVLLG